jgi:hypothetical protein
MRCQDYEARYSREWNELLNSQDGFVERNKLPVRRVRFGNTVCHPWTDVERTAAAFFDEIHRASGSKRTLMDAYANTRRAVSRTPGSVAGSYC